MSEVFYPLLVLLSFFALAAALLKLGELAGHLLKIKGLLFYLLAGVGLLLSGLGWEAYAAGRCTIWQALGGSILLGGLPLWAALWLIVPDFLHAFLNSIARRFRR